MKFSIKATNLELTSDIYDHIERTINSLDKFVEKADYSVVQAWVEVGRTSQRPKSGKIYRAEIQINLPGRLVRSEAVADTIFLAINEVRDELQRELKQYKGKKMTEQKDGFRKFKEIKEKIHEQ